MSSAELYKEYIQKVGDRTELFELLGNKFDIVNAIYPGSYIDITSSFFKKFRKKFCSKKGNGNYYGIFRKKYEGN